MSHERLRSNVQVDSGVVAATDTLDETNAAGRLTLNFPYLIDNTSNVHMFRSSRPLISRLVEAIGRINEHKRILMNENVIGELHDVQLTTYKCRRDTNVYGFACYAIQSAFLDHRLWNVSKHRSYSLMEHLGHLNWMSTDPQSIPYRIKEITNYICRELHLNTFGQNQEIDRSEVLSKNIWNWKENLLKAIKSYGVWSEEYVLLHAERLVGEVEAGMPDRIFRGIHLGEAEFLQPLVAGFKRSVLSRHNNGGHNITQAQLTTLRNTDGKKR